MPHYRPVFTALIIVRSFLSHVYVPCSRWQFNTTASKNFRFNHEANVKVEIALEVHRWDDNFTLKKTFAGCIETLQDDGDLDEILLVFATVEVNGLLADHFGV